MARPPHRRPPIPRPPPPRRTRAPPQIPASPRSAAGRSAGHPPHSLRPTAGRPQTRARSPRHRARCPIAGRAVARARSSRAAAYGPHPHRPRPRPRPGHRAAADRPPHTPPPDPRPPTTGNVLSYDHPPRLRDRLMAATTAKAGTMPGVSTRLSRRPRAFIAATPEPHRPNQARQPRQPMMHFSTSSSPKPIASPCPYENVQKLHTLIDPRISASV